MSTPPETNNNDPMDKLRKRLRDIYSEIEAIDKTINIKQTVKSDFSIEGDAVKSLQWRQEVGDPNKPSTVDPAFFEALRKGHNFAISGTCSIDEKTIEKLKKMTNKQGIRFILDVEQFDEYAVTKKGGKITYTLTFDEQAIPANTSNAAGLLGISSLADKWDYDSISIDVSPNEFYARLENLRKKN